MMDHLTTILDALGAQIDQLSTTLVCRDYQLREAHDQLDIARRELQDVRADMAAQTEERAKDQVIMVQTAKLVGKLRDKAHAGEEMLFEDLESALDNILAVIADCAKEEAK